MTNKIVAIVGIHTAGKTTLLDNLKENYSLTIERELAEEIRVNNSIRAGATGSSDFEKKVMQAEIERDRCRTWSKENVVFIESWHILTYAYMMTKSQNELLIQEYKCYIEQLKVDFEVECIFLDVDADVLRVRKSRLHSENEIESVIEFYNKLNRNIQNTLVDLNIKTTRIDARAEENIIAKRVALNYIDCG